MGSASSSQGRGGGGGADDDDDEEEEEDEDDEDETSAVSKSNHSESKVLEQEPEILPCHAPATPISAASTPRVLGPSIRVWDPCNVLLPPPPPAPPAGSDSLEVFLISHGECAAGLRPDLVGGRWSSAGLTGNGERQTRALAVFLNSQGVRFGAVYCSPLDRARATAAFVCQELEFAEEQIKSADSLIEMSQGQWEGCHRSEVYTPEFISLIDKIQPDFSAPSGESLRQVQFRMIEFLNRTVLRLPEKLVGESSLHRNDSREFTRQGSSNSVQDRDGPQWELLYKHRQGLQRKKSGKSRLQSVTTGDNKIEDEFSEREANRQNLLHEGDTNNPATSIGIFTHSTPIKCLVTGLLDCSPAMSQKICIDDSSVTVLQHSLHTGWQIKRLNDTSHLRLL